MDYQTFEPHPDLQALVKFYWTLEVPADPDVQRQRILPDGCIDLVFILGDDIKRYTSGNDFILQPRAMMLGQITEPFYVEPTGAVDSFAARFYPYGFANFTTVPIKELANKETPIAEVFGAATANSITQQITAAAGTPERVTILNNFLLQLLHEQSMVDSILKSTIDTILATKGSLPINAILKGAMSKRRQLERNFSKQVGISPKQLGRIIRLQAALKMLLEQKSESLTHIAYKSHYYDQSHFIMDFKEFTGVTPKDFYNDETLALSALFYAKD